MKKAVQVILISVLVLSVSYAEDIPGWDDNTTYLYGLFLKQTNGESLPSAPVPRDCLEKGLKVNIQNGMPFRDRITLLFVINGCVQPFVFKGDTTYSIMAYIDPGEIQEYDVYFCDWIDGGAELQYLHVVSVGLLDSMPKSIYDYNDVYTSICTIPISVNNTADDEENSARMEQVKLPSGLIDWADEVGDFIAFSAGMDESNIYLLNAVEEISCPCKLEVIAIAPEKEASVLLLVDGKPWQPEEKLMNGYAESGSALCTEYDLSSLIPGEHLAYALLLPEYERVLLPTAAHRLKLVIR